jgi:hypothetical protein
LRAVPEPSFSGNGLVILIFTSRGIKAAELGSACSSVSYRLDIHFLLSTHTFPPAYWDTGIHLKRGFSPRPSGVWRPKEHGSIP